MVTEEDYIGVFDSGVGGISVLKELVKLLPEERFLYFGDSANAPYGTRPAQQVQALVKRAVEKLMPYGLKALVLACNTATATAIDALREAYPQLVIIGIEPALKLAADRYPGGTVGVMATPITLQEEKFRHLWQRCESQCTAVALPAPGLADLVEAGRANSEESEALLRPLLSPWVGKLDALVLGCTHYPFAAPTLKKLLGEIPLLDGSQGTARQTQRQLASKSLLRRGAGEILIKCSGDAESEQRCWELLKE